jgi:hypothetical protein
MYVFRNAIVHGCVAVSTLSYIKDPLTKSVCDTYSTGFYLFIIKSHYITALELKDERKNLCSGLSGIHVWQPCQLLGSGRKYVVVRIWRAEKCRFASFDRHLLNQTSMDTKKCCFHSSKGVSKQPDFRQGDTKIVHGTRRSAPVVSACPMVLLKRRSSLGFAFWLHVTMSKKGRMGSLSNQADLDTAAIARGPRMQEMSEAIPFMERPKKLDSKAPGVHPAHSVCRYQRKVHKEILLLTWVHGHKQDTLASILLVSRTTMT